MMRRLAGWGARAMVTLAVGFAVLYLGDWGTFMLRGAPHSTVTVHRTLVVPLKGNKQEYDDQGSFALPCSVSLFAQGGLDACWKLRRNPNQNLTF